MMEIRHTVTDTATRPLNKIREILPKGLLNAARGIVAAMVRYTVKSKFENKGPVYLNRRTGTAIRSVTASPSAEPARIEGDFVRAGYGSHVEYVRAHEFGFSGTVNVRAHVRRLVELVTSRAAARRVRARIGRGAARYAHVRAHKRAVHMRERRMFRDALDEKSTVIEAATVRAIETMVREQRLPTPAEIGSIVENR